MQLDHTRALSAGHRSVAATFSLTVFDQGEGGRDFVAVFECEGARPSSASADRTVDRGGSQPTAGDAGEDGSQPSAGDPAEHSGSEGAPAPSTPGRRSDGTSPSNTRALQRSPHGPRQGVFSRETDTWGGCQLAGN